MRYDSRVRGCSSESSEGICVLNDCSDCPCASASHAPGWMFIDYMQTYAKLEHTGHNELNTEGQEVRAWSLSCQYYLFARRLSVQPQATEAVAPCIITNRSHSFEGTYARVVAPRPIQRLHARLHARMPGVRAHPGGAGAAEPVRLHAQQPAAVRPRPNSNIFYLRRTLQRWLSTSQAILLGCAPKRLGSCVR